MSSRNTAKTIPEQIAEIYEILRRQQTAQVVAGEVVVVSGGSGAPGATGPAGAPGAAGTDGATGPAGPVVWARFFATMGS